MLHTRTGVAQTCFSSSRLRYNACGQAVFGLPVLYHGFFLIYITFGRWASAVEGPTGRAEAVRMNSAKFVC